MATTDPLRVSARAPNLAGNYLAPALATPRRRTLHQEEGCGTSAGLRVEPAAASTHEPSQSSLPSVPPAQRRAARAHHALLRRRARQQEEGCGASAGLRA